VQPDAPSKNEAAAWQSAKANGTWIMYQAFLTSYPESRFAPEAQIAISKIFDTLKLTEEQSHPKEILFSQSLWSSTVTSVTTASGEKKVFESHQDRQTSGIRLHEQDAKITATDEPVSIYAGQCPFQCDDISVDTSKMLIWRDPDYFFTIHIDAIEGDIAIPTANSLVAKGWERAVGVAWMFRDKGVKIRTQEQIYETLETNASLMFTKWGVMTSKIKVTRLAFASDKRSSK